MMQQSWLLLFFCCVVSGLLTAATQANPSTDLLRVPPTLLKEIPVLASTAPREIQHALLGALSASAGQHVSALTRKELQVRASQRRTALDERDAKTVVTFALGQYREGNDIMAHLVDHIAYIQAEGVFIGALKYWDAITGQLNDNPAHGDSIFDRLLHNAIDQIPVTCPMTESLTANVMVPSTWTSLGCPEVETLRALLYVYALAGKSTERVFNSRVTIFAINMKKWAAVNLIAQYAGAARR